MKGFTYERATSWAIASERLANGNARAQGGGIDNLDLLKEGLIEPEAILSLQSLKPAQDGILKSGKSIQIHSLSTLAEVSEHPVILREATALAQAAGMAATPNIRNGATVGGNLCQETRCSYFRSALFDCLRRGGTRCPALEGDNEYHGIFENTFCAAVLPSSLAVSLTALDAKVVVHQTDGSKKRLSMGKLYRSALEDTGSHLTLAPGELIESVEVPTGGKQFVSQYLKVKPRDSFDWPLVECAIALQLDGEIIERARVVMGGVAMIPWRATLVEETLRGKTLNPQLAKEVAKRAAHGATPLSNNEYKTTLMEGCVERVLQMIMEKEGGVHAPRR